jgi:hypothetical protein
MSLRSSLARVRQRQDEVVLRGDLHRRTLILQLTSLRRGFGVIGWGTAAAFLLGRKNKKESHTRSETR